MSQSNDDRPTLMVDSNGTVNCGVCGYLAITVKGKDANGRWIEERILTLFPTLLDGQHRRMFTVLKSAGIPACAWLAQVVMARLPRPSSLGVPQVLTRALLVGFVLVGPARGLYFAGSARRCCGSFPNR